MRDSGGRNLTYNLQEKLGRAIVTGSFAETPFPTEAELAKAHGVSRSVTREAVKMLSAKGLLGARPRLGTFVAPLAQWNLLDPDVLRWLLERQFSLLLLRQFSELRMAIEPAAAALAARDGSADALAAIRRGYARMEAAGRGEDDVLDADIAFHIAILHATANPFFFQFEELVNTALRTSIKFTNRRKGRTASLPAHGRVLHAIESGDEEGARKAMLNIIDEVLDLVNEGVSPDLA